MIPELEEVLTGVEGLEPFPASAVRVLELSLASEPDPVEIARVVRGDAPMAAKVLRLANAPGRGALVQIDSIDRAAVQLGARTLAQLALTSGAHTFYSGLGSSTPRSNRSLWGESVTNAVAARLVAEEHGRERPDLHYTVGLLMNIGHVVLDRFLRTYRDDVLAKLDQGRRMLRAEHEVLGVTHAELGALLAERWSFPASLVDPIRHHHAPRDGADAVLCADLNLAEALTWEQLAGDGTRTLCYGVSGSTVRFTGLEPRRLEALRGRLPECLADEAELIAID